MTTKKVYLAAVIFLFFGLFILMGGCASQTEPTAGVAQNQAEPLVAIGSIESSETADTTNVTIAGNGPLTFSSFKKPDPPSVVLIFPATTVSQLPPNPVLDSDLIDQVVVSEGNGGSTARIEFKLAADAAYTATQKGDKVWLTFQRPEAGVAESEAAAVPASSSTPDPAAAEAPAPVNRVEKIHAPATDIPKSTAWVNKIDFLSESAGKSTLVLGTTHVVDYRIHKIGPQKIELKLLNTRIPAYRQRALITTRFNSAVDRIVPYQATQQKNETRVSIEMRQAVPYYVEQTDNLLLVHFDSSSVPPRPMEMAQLPAWKKSLANDQQAPEIQGSTTAKPESMAGVSDESVESAPDKMQDYYVDSSLENDTELKSLISTRKKHYTGEKIAIDFYNTDIKNVFRILREVSGKNFAIDKDVTGKVTMTLDKPVPWDQVLDLVLRMNQLGKTYEGDIVRIATLETLKNEDDLRKAKLEALRKSREEAKALEPLVTKYIAVSYANAETEVKPHIEKILTKGRGSVSVDQKNNQLIITDTEAKVAQATDIVRRIDKVTSQVIIEAKVVEVSNDFSRSLGIDWTLAYGDSTDPLNTANTDWAMNFPVSSATSTIGVTFSRLTGVPYVINAQLNALETNGEGHILSSPKILTLDNKKAMIKQGLEYPYFERDSTGGSSVKFKDVDLLLEVTPHVTPDNRISMAINLTKNDVDSLVGVEQVPALATNETQTELLVNDGDTVVIGGIIKATDNDSTSGFPGLSKIPLLGWLFKNNTRSTANKELLIFITPRIVQLEQDVSNIAQ
jgi:type IV pilus assembly protein PilQ